MPLRNRDILALLSALILSRLVWNDSTESIQASVDLAFYLSRDQATVTTPVDLDGDGTNEAFAVVQRSPANQTAWILKVLDLKPMHAPSHQRAATSISVPPFQPAVLFQTEDHSHQQDAVPIQLTSGQVLIHKSSHTARKPGSYNMKDPTKMDAEDRTRHYFCGVDWHHASQQCLTPCPSGLATDCPDGERCFADTTCDSLAVVHEDVHDSMVLTPGGGLPSIVTLWSNGVLALHSITKDKSASDLELREMWHHHLIPESILPKDVDWLESNVLFLDALETTEASNAEYGMVVVSGIYSIMPDSGEEEPIESSFLVAVDAKEGTVLWDSFVDQEKDSDPLPLPLTRGTSSNARRRSLIASLGSAPTSLRENQPNCQVTFQHHLQHVLPYAYWNAKDAHLAAFHLDATSKSKSSHHHHPMSAGKDAPKLSPGGHASSHHSNKWTTHRHFSKRHGGHKHHPLHGRPNVLVTQTKGGMQIRSLKNGRPICHVSFLEETLYADLNNDGALDQVQFLLPSAGNERDDEWTSRLKNHLNKTKGRSREQTGGVTGQNVCHALALSGMPAREELFSTPLCGAAHQRTTMLHPAMKFSSVAPVVVESLSGRRNTRDVIVALSHGMVHRLHGRSGRREWAVMGNQQDDFPTWDETENALLTRLQSSNIPAPLRPVLLAGENSLAVLGVTDGSILASVKFPQFSTARPILGDVSGDGTIDVVILSKDGIWGYQVRARVGNAVGQRIMVGLLLAGLMLAVLRNRFGGSRKDVRATDP
eukprot:Nitzschia sp. Nitz4//scaffold131_size63436//43994//46288//NITZ4_006281-RA/size63436-processed-gene-0.121-mRNA-1//-1//CDS//3329535286//8555//frame0